MKLFAGLGNPGTNYQGNRHNIGFMAVERIAQTHGFSPWRKKFNALISEGSIGTERVMLLKPETFMNDSGRAVGEAMRFLKIAEADVYVFHDELGSEEANSMSKQIAALTADQRGDQLQRLERGLLRLERINVQTLGLLQKLVEAVKKPDGANK